MSFLAISKAKLSQIEAYRQRMGWSFKWVSSFANEFNRDFNVSFTDKEVKNERGYYNYRERRVPREEMQGMSVFARDDDGNVYHTYSSYGRGVDMINGAYHLLDRVPSGRDEDDLTWTQAWLRRHDEYEQE